ncbi:hypothetical protein F5Y06DRAFT_215084 [Hypoxylon sp. FL0890]|nr:hypothetical protein F5Y06DRAFT_215084 [Hypoxylon sp. FL0890]
MSNDGSKMEGLPLPDNIILALAEQLDTKSMFNLMETSEQIHDLIRHYEFSISMGQAAKFMSPVGNILSSEVFARRCIQRGTFEMVAEMEMREARIEDILSNSGYIDLMNPMRIGPLNVTQQKRLYGLLKRAMRHCDRIADMAANQPCRPIMQQSYDRLKAKHFNASNLPLGFRLQDPTTNFGARPLQFEYIKNLPIEDLAMVFYLLNALEAGYYRTMADYAASDPDLENRLLVFKECILRHGSWYAWGYVCGSGPWKVMADAISQVGMVELISFEFNMDDEEEQADHIPPSLHSAFWARFDAMSPSDNTGKAEIYRIVESLVKGDEGEFGDEREGEEG